MRYSGSVYLQQLSVYVGVSGRVNGVVVWGCRMNERLGVTMSKAKTRSGRRFVMQVSLAFARTHVHGGPFTSTTSSQSRNSALEFSHHDVQRSITALEART